VSGREKVSDYSMSETLAGRRVLFGSISTFKNMLSKRFKQNKPCGFHIGSTIKNDGYFMLFNKQLDNTLRVKMNRW
jgi:hypothetical protein